MEIEYSDSIVEIKSFRFSVRIVRLCQYLQNQKKEYVISKQLLRAGTSIGANIAEGKQGQSRPDFISKLSIALKETAETKYWLHLLRATEYLNDVQFNSIVRDCQEIEKLLVSIVKSSK